MIIYLELDDKVYGFLEDEASTRGITVQELIRWLIGEHAKYANPPTLTLKGPVPSYPTQVEIDKMQAETDKIVKLSGLMMKSMIKDGAIKCQNCTLGLSLEDLEQGHCSNCGVDI